MRDPKELFIKENKNLTEKTNKPYPKKPLVEKLKSYTSLHESVTDTDEYNKLCESYQTLLDLDDDLILLILENNVLNGMIHHQKIVLEDIAVQFDNPHNITAHLGRFDKNQRKVTIIKGPTNIYDETVIHEFTHAANGFAFVFDPLPVKNRLEERFKTEECRQSIFNNTSKEFRRAAVLPHPAYECPYQRDKIDNNIAALKFKQCVRRDMQNYQDNTENPFNLDPNISLMDNAITLFMINIDLHIKKVGYSTRTLEEVLPLYMECRLNLLKIARDHNLPCTSAYNKLAEKIPHIHAYCETDFKKVLKYRLQYYRSRYNDGYYSEYLKRHATVPTSSVTTTFHEAGTLKFTRSEFIPKKSAEISARLFAQRIKAKKNTETVQSAIQEENNSTACALKLKRKQID